MDLRLPAALDRHRLCTSTARCKQAGNCTILQRSIPAHRCTPSACRHTPRLLGPRATSRPSQSRHPATHLPAPLAPHPHLPSLRPTQSPLRPHSTPPHASSNPSLPSPSLPPPATPLYTRVATLSAQLTRLFPLWVVLAAVLGFYHPPLFAWFGTQSITFGLMFVMAGMGLTLTFSEILSVFTHKPQLLLLGMFLQYTILPTLGFAISRFWALPTSLAAGVALVSCMPGGTASNIVAYIAKGDMPLSIMMTTASTFMAILTTPILTSLLVGTIVPIDPTAMFLSVLQLVLAPVLLGAAANQLAPGAVTRVRPFTPLAATAVVVLIVGSMIGSNVQVVAQSGFHIVTAVFTLHGAGFLLGYTLSKAMGLSDKIARTNSIEVGMQSSALAAVLAKLHFADPVVVAPCVLSACTHATMGSLLAGYWAATCKDEE